MASTLIEQETTIAQPILQPITLSANPILAGIRSFQLFSQERLSHSETADSGWNAIIPNLLTRKTLSFRDRLFWLVYHHSNSSHKKDSLIPRPPILAGIPSFQLFSQERLSHSETAYSGWNTIIPTLLIRKTLSYPRPPILAEIPSFQIFSQDFLTSEIADSGWNAIIPILLTGLSRIRDRQFWL